MYPESGRSYEELYSSALKALYFAKHSVSSDIVFDEILVRPTKYLTE